MERSVDFFRSRHMSCTGFGHTFMADLDWIDRWEQGQEVCPGCGVNCEEELAPRVTVDPDDLALIDSNVSPLFWYHTTTQDDWPTLNFNPAAGFTDDTVQAMGGLARVAAWEDRQRRKALHAGTYEAAIHNMLRRIATKPIGESSSICTASTSSLQSRSGKAGFRTPAGSSETYLSPRCARPAST